MIDAIVTFFIVMVVINLVKEVWKHRADKTRGQEMMTKNDLPPKMAAKIVPISAAPSYRYDPLLEKELDELDDLFN